MHGLLGGDHGADPAEIMCPPGCGAWEEAWFGLCISAADPDKLRDMHR